MSEISKQALKVDNSTSFPNNNTGYISPTILRAFNVNMIDSLVDEIGYTADSASWNVSIGALNTYTASFAPTLSSLNAFTASQLVVNSNLNLFTQSANASINRLDSFSSSFNTYTASINQIRSNGVTLGTSTIFNLVGPGTFFSASLVQNVQGNIATLTFTSDNGKVNTSSFNDYTQSTNQIINGLSASFNPYTASNDQKVNSLIARTGSYATTGSNTFVDTQTINVNNGDAIIASGSITLSPGTFISASIIRPTSGIEMQPQTYFRFLTGSSYFNMQLTPTTGDWSFSRSGASNVKVLQLAGLASATSSFENNSVRFLDTVPNVIFDTPVRILKGIGTSIQVTGSLELSDRILVTSGGAQITGGLNVNGNSFIAGNQEIKNGALQVASYNENFPQYISPTVFQGVGTQSVAYDQFVNGGNYDAIHIQSNLNAGTDFQDLNANTFGLETWLNIPTNTGNNPAPVFKRGLEITGSLTITGSTYGNVISASIASSTASIDLSSANYFTLTLSGSTRINVTNPRPGNTAILRITTSATSSVTFSSNVLQPTGSIYSPTGGANNIDILTLTAFDTSSVYVISATQFK